MGNVKLFVLTDVFVAFKFEMNEPQLIITEQSGSLGQCIRYSARNGVYFLFLV